MSLRRRILTVAALLVALSVSAFAVAISYDSACGAPPTRERVVGERMKAVVAPCYGGPEVLRLAEVARPTIGENEVLVEVHAASVNALDWRRMRGQPYVMRLGNGFGAPAEPRIGVDYAGTVVAVGPGVTRFQLGDEVFGGRTGSFAEYVDVYADRSIALKPKNLTFEQAAAVPAAAMTALQAARDGAQVRRGQRVLVNGASGGVGTFTVQIAKALGAHVTAVCSTRNVELVRSLGADRVIDYTREDFTQGAERYDVVIDNVGNHGLLAMRGVLEPEGKLVIVGAPSGGWLRPLAGAIKAELLAPFVEQSMTMIMSRLNAPDLEYLSSLIEAGKVTPIIDRRYTLEQVAEAVSYVEEGHARAKVVVSID